MRRVAHLIPLPVTVLLLAGCLGGEPGPAPAPSLAVQASAQAAGGACRLLDYRVIEDVTGLSFGMAASAVRGDTNTCVVRVDGAALPEMSLAVAPSTADVAVFRAMVRPGSAETVEDLGREGFRVLRGPGSGRGPSVEVGWLTGDARLMQLTLTLPAETDLAPADAADLLVELAREVDKSSV